MSAMQHTLAELQNHIDDLTKLVEQLLDERTDLISQLNAKKQRTRSAVVPTDEHLQKDWLSDV